MPINSQPIRIALCTQAAPWEGQPRSGLYNLRLAAALCDGGHRCDIFALTMKGPRFLERWVPKLAEFNARPDEYVYEGVRFHTIRGYLPHPNAVRWKIAPRFPAIAGGIFRRAFARGLESALRRSSPDVVLFHDGVSLGRLGLAVHRSLSVPWGIIEQDALELDPNTPIGREYARTLSSTRAVWYLAERYAAHARIRLGLTQAGVMFNGTLFPTPKQCMTGRPDRWKGKKITLCVGTYVPRKGHDVLVRAFAKSSGPDHLLLIVGNPPPPALSSLVRELGIGDRVEFLDYMRQEELPQYMVWADLFALTSWDEPFGMVYVEALAAETPVIMCADCGLVSQIEPGRHGWIVPVRDVEATVAALREAFAPGTDLRAMGRMGKALVEKKFTWESSARQILEAINPARA